MYTDLYSFVFRGLLTEEALDKAGRKSRPVFDASENSILSTKLSVELLDIDKVKKAERMAVVYIAIASFENTVRKFVEKKLLEEFGENWWVSCVPEKIRKSAEVRKQEEGKTRWQSSRGDSNINFVDFGDLVSIIQKDENWTYFEPHLGTVEWARGISDVVEKSRNIIMHSCELGDKDIERVGMNIRDWIRQVGA